MKVIKRMPPLGKAVPNFTILDFKGKKYTFQNHRGRPVALCFFCGCSACAEVAHQWAQFQRGKALPKESVTVIIYQGTSEALKALADRAALDLTQTVLLPDPDGKITNDLYHADPCPRLLVIDQKGILRYANVGPDDKPQEAPAAIITAKALDKLNKCGPGSRTPKLRK